MPRASLAHGRGRSRAISAGASSCRVSSASSPVPGVPGVAEMGSPSPSSASRSACSAIRRGRGRAGRGADVGTGCGRRRSLRRRDGRGCRCGRAHLPSRPIRFTFVPISTPPASSIRRTSLSPARRRLRWPGRSTGISHPRGFVSRLRIRPDGTCGSRSGRTPYSILRAGWRGGEPADLLPAGNEGSVWRRRMNEAQMVLHAHPGNEAREARGELPVNSVWFWGAGELGAAPRAPVSRGPYRRSPRSGLGGAGGRPGARAGRRFRDRGGGGRSPSDRARLRLLPRRPGP